MPGGRGLDFYEILEVDYSASYEEIRASYRRLRREYRDNERKSALIAEAWSVLSDEVSKKRYDQNIRVAERQLRYRKPGKVSAPRTPASKSQASSLGEQRTGKSLSDTEVLSSGLSKTDVFSSIPDTQILDEQNSEPLVPLTRTLILAEDAEPTDQPYQAIDMDETVTRLRDEHRVQTHILKQPPATLKVVLADGAKKAYSLDREKTTIGRKSENDIVLEDPEMYISREHASIIIRADQYYVVDHDSANGTFIRGKRIPPNREIPLTDGETIEIEGRQLTLCLKAVQGSNDANATEELP
jgi:pSer/pThr/pTyr-binding forkhead associated (FHA) protein